jgi:hypothetical protein
VSLSQSVKTSALRYWSRIEMLSQLAEGETEGVDAESTGQARVGSEDNHLPLPVCFTTATSALWHPAGVRVTAAGRSTTGKNKT